MDGRVTREDVKGQGRPWGWHPSAPETCCPVMRGMKSTHCLFRGTGTLRSGLLEYGTTTAVTTTGPSWSWSWASCHRSTAKIYYRTLDEILDGWTQVSTQEGGLAWVRIRLIEASGSQHSLGRLQLQPLAALEAAVPQHEAGEDDRKAGFPPPPR